MAGVYCIVICKNAARRASFSFSFSFSSSLISSFSFFPFYSSVPCLLCKLFLIFLFLLLLLLFCPLPPALVLFLFLFVVTPDHKQCEKKYRNALETAPKKKGRPISIFRASGKKPWMALVSTVVRPTMQQQAACCNTRTQEKQLFSCKDRTRQ